MTANWTPALGKASRLAAHAASERDRLILLAHEDGVPTEEIAAMCGMERAEVERIIGVEPDDETLDLPVEGPTMAEEAADKPGRRPRRVP